MQGFLVLFGQLGLVLRRKDMFSQQSEMFKHATWLISLARFDAGSVCLGSQEHESCYKQPGRGAEAALENL